MELPTEIGNLSNIRWLQLCNNNLSGEIPPSIQKMEQLEVLDLENNLFAGEIPTGQIPIWISNQTDLAFLDLSNNNLEGTLPQWLAQRDLSGLLPDTIGQATEMIILRLSGNNFFGPIPTSISNMLELVLLDLSSNRFSGNKFPVFNPNSSLLYIDLSSNKLSGKVPTTFPLGIKVLVLSQNEFSHVLPQNLSNLNQLEYLDLHSNNIGDLSNNKLEGRIPSGPQMDRMNDPNSYANNNGLCGMQIKVSCEKVPSEPKLKEEKTKKSNSWEIWFSWEMAVIGYPSGFLSTVLVISSISNIDLQGLETWNAASDDCCQWRRLDCTFQNVTDLHLSDLIPSQDLKPVVTSDILAPLFHLQTLISFDISYNNIHGEIPRVGFANLSNLVSLHMRGNSFNGSIPPSLFSLRHLEELDMSDNLIEGTLGTNFGNLTNLHCLSLFNNKISGAIPPSLSNLKSLEYLNLRENFLTMELPTEIGNLSNIRWLLLCDNNLSGEIPPSIQKMEQVQVLDLENNLFAGEIPTWLFDFNYLFYLSLGENKLVLKNARIAPRCMLMRLSLRSCNLSGKIPIWISNQTDLAFLDLSNNNLEGTLPQWLAQRDLSGLLPDTIGQATEMIILRLSGNNFSGPIPTSISNMLELMLLDLSSNRFSGNKFPVFNPKSSLLYIDLSSNKLSGQVPTTFPLGIKVLVLSQNEFYHVLPQNLSNLNQMEYLDLHSNNIGGEIPNSLGELKNLKSLNLSQNKLSGRIPLSFGGLQSLESLDLSHNNFFGEIPCTLANLFELSYLDLSNNKLEGRIPSGPHMDRMNDPNSYANNSGLCGMQIKVSCEKVPSEPKLKEEKTKKSNSWEIWFSWEMAVIGYPSGFLSTVLVMYVIGYFNITPQPGRRKEEESLLCEKVPSEPKLKEEKTKKSNSWEIWFSWEMAVIGYPSGFLSTVLVIFNGSIPPYLFSLRHLQALHTDYNLIHGGIPTQIGNLTNLYRLSLSNNKISGAIPTSLSHLKSLVELNLRQNFLTMLPNDIGNLSNKASLLLNDNNLSGEFPSSFQKLEQLEQLNLENNLFAGEIPTWLFDFKNLLELNLGANKLVLKNARIAPRCMLDVLSLRSCNLSGQIPIWISNQTELIFLDLSDNNHEGTLPQWLAQRDLVGGMPNTISEATEMSILLLSGPIPTPISNMHKLRSLDLSSNRFSGNEFPIFNPNSSMLYIDLSSNKLSGQVPTTFRLGIKVLVLAQNEFSHVLPQNLSNFSQLVYLDLRSNNIGDLSNNKLEGRIPPGPQMDTMNDPNSYANNNGLCGMQIKASCEEVPSKPKLKERKTKKRKSWKTWFSWEMAVTGYSSGFLSTILVMYVNGYYNIPPQPGRRRLVRHGLFGFKAFDMCFAWFMLF
ncbi:hypothetical protein GH714_034847 [Hevea brasiliensis]|uniref:Leucine-rich repeat-containing N-terminal plant-type domain-containing protein n=1 Tax=Hevea brasiliensis TaxID=3981 RepID=A0A6A6L4H4_HEVBR|nr:hypothetical protein GH714_034847 [Hevea brasiliensis]